MSRHGQHEQRQANGSTGNGGAGGDHTLSSPPIQVHHHYHSEHLHYPLTQNFDTKRLEDLLEMVVMHQQSQLKAQDITAQSAIEIELYNHRILERLEHMSVTTDRLAREVAETRAGIESTNLLLGRIAEYIREHSEDAALLEEFADDLDGATATLAAAAAAIPAFQVGEVPVDDLETPPGEPTVGEPATEPVVMPDSTGEPSSSPGTGPGAGEPGEEF